jgi:hypothetical protein
MPSEQFPARTRHIERTLRGGRVVDDVSDWTSRFQAAAAEWSRLTDAEQVRDAALVERWKQGFLRAKNEEQRLVEAGRWLGGPRTLLAALDLQYRELKMTAGLAWLLRPDGHHGLGRAVLDGILQAARSGTVDTSEDVHVVVEETRADTIADLVVYGRGWTMIVEAKTFAAERPRQLDRIYENWMDEPKASFVFLTRGHRLPVTAKLSKAQWHLLTWRQVAGTIRAATVSAASVAPGVLDYTKTLELFHDV